ncbi:MAG: hypothetical protein ABH886_03270, partial [Candidatus Desantisbacteria bacterium]
MPILLTTVCDYSSPLLGEFIVMQKETRLGTGEQPKMIEQPKAIVESKAIGQPKIIEQSKAIVESKIIEEPKMIAKACG